MKRLWKWFLSLFKRKTTKVELPSELVKAKKELEELADDTFRENEETKSGRIRSLEYTTLSPGANTQSRSHKQQAKRKKLRKISNESRKINR